MMQQLVRIKAVQPLHGFNVHLEFTDGTNKEIDLEPYLHGPIFEPVRTHPDLFQRVYVDHELGTIVWDNGADIDPDVLHYELLPAWMELESTQ
jgi:hypothetical protein